MHPSLVVRNQGILFSCCPSSVTARSSRRSQHSWGAARRRSSRWTQAVVTVALINQATHIDPAGWIIPALGF